MTFSITVEGLYAAIIACVWLLSKAAVTWYVTKKQFADPQQN